MALVAGTLLVAGPPAHACSCAAGQDIRLALNRADGAFVGTLTSRDKPKGEGNGSTSSTEMVANHFKVEQSVKGRFGPTQDVYSEWSGASCGIEAAPGTRIGLLLGRRDERWHSGLCAQVDPDVLLAAAKPLSVKAGGPPVVILGGSFGSARAAALDRDGVLVALGPGEPRTHKFAACPGGSHVAELVGIEADPSRTEVAVRRTDTLRVERELQLTTGYQGFQPYELSCRNGDGTDLFVYLHNEQGEGEIVRLQRSRRSVLWRGLAVNAALASRTATAYVTSGAYEQPQTLSKVDLDTGKAHRLGTLPEAHRLRLNASETYLLVDALRGPMTVRVDPPAAPKSLDGSEFARAAWAGDRVVVGLRDPTSTFAIFDAELQRVGGWAGWGAEEPIVAGDRVYAMREGDVVWAPLETGPAQPIRELTGTRLWAAVAVPPRVGTSATPPPALETTTTVADVAPTSTSSSTTIEEAALEEKPTSSTSSRWPEALAAALVLLAGGGAVWVRRRRRSSP